LDQWGQVFGGADVIAAAILYRLLHHSHVIVTKGPGYRMKDKLAHCVHSEVDSGIIDDVSSQPKGWSEQERPR